MKQLLPMVDAPHEHRSAFVADAEQKLASGIDTHDLKASAMCKHSQASEWITVERHCVKTQMFVGRKHKEFGVNCQPESGVGVLRSNEGKQV